MSEETKTFNLKAFAADLINYRNTKLGLGRSGFSRETGISRHVINHIENNHTKPQIDDAYKLATLMGKDLIDYFQ